jgi:hypothetical protein
MPDNVKHGPYIPELKAGCSVFKEVVAPQFGVAGENDFGGADFSLGWSYLTRPFLMVKDAHQHDFDQFVVFCGGDPNNVVEFGGEVEFGVDGNLATINYPACV